MGRVTASRELKEKRKFTTKQMTYLGVMAALAVVLAALVHFPILPQAGFLEYDPADIPLFIVAFAFGPLPALLLTVVVSVIQGVTVSAASGVIGIIMHIAATGTAVLVAGGIYSRRKTRKTAVIALISGVLSMTGVMILMNLLLTPIYMGVPMEQVLLMILPVILPFNLIKAGINATVAFLVYKAVGRIFGDRMELAKKNAQAEDPHAQQS